MFGIAVPVMGEPDWLMLHEVREHYALSTRDISLRTVEELPSHYWRSLQVTTYIGDTG